MRLHSQNYRCSDCGIVEPEFIELAADAPRSSDSCPEVISEPCPYCRGTNRLRTVGAPMVTSVALPDGTDRGNLYNLTKGAALARSDALRAKNPEDRARLTKEAAKMDSMATGTNTEIRTK